MASRKKMNDDYSLLPLQLQSSSSFLASKIITGAINSQFNGLYFFEMAVAIIFCTSIFILWSIPLSGLCEAISRHAKPHPWHQWCIPLSGSCEAILRHGGGLCSPIHRKSGAPLWAVFVKPFYYMEVAILCSPIHCKSAAPLWAVSVKPLHHIEMTVPRSIIHS